MLRLPFICLCVALLASGCASLGNRTVGADGTRAHALAELILETQAHHPERIVAADPQIEALIEVLAPAVEAQDSEMDLVRRSQLDDGMIDLSGARSMLNAVHLASYRSRDNAVAGWLSLQSDHDSLTGLSARLSQADLGERGQYLRLKAGPFDKASEAEGLCSSLRNAGLWCAPTDFTGEPL